MKSSVAADAVRDQNTVNRRFAGWRRNDHTISRTVPLHTYRRSSFGLLASWVREFLHAGLSRHANDVAVCLDLLFDQPVEQEILLGLEPGCSPRWGQKAPRLASRRRKRSRRVSCITTFLRRKTPPPHHGSGKRIDLCRPPLRPGHMAGEHRGGGLNFNQGKNPPALSFVAAAAWPVWASA